MEIILKEDIQNVGFKDDLVEVKNGYARNFLIPQGKAIIATNSAKKVLDENLKQKAFKEKKIIKEAESLGKKLLEIEIKISSKVSNSIIKDSLPIIKLGITNLIKSLIKLITKK